MGWVARIAASGTALSFVGCALLAGLDDPQRDAPIDDGGSVQNTSTSSGATSTSSGSTSSGSTSSSGSVTDGNASSSSGDATTTDAPIDTGPTCTLFKNGDACQAASQCCSNKCNEDRKCATSCTSVGQFGCNPASTTSCCVGAWCNGTQCAACITSGQEAASPGGFPLPQSCCSRALKIASTQCQ